MDVGVRELKQHLSGYLDRAERGEVITVTERGRPKAMLVPLPGGGDQLAAGVEEGWITPAKASASLGHSAPVPATTASSVADALDLDRGA